VGIGHTRYTTAGDNSIENAQPVVSRSRLGSVVLAHNGNLIELIVYDSLGIEPIIKYEIYDENVDIFKCRSTEYLEEGYSSQEYWIRKAMEIDHNYFEFIFQTLQGIPEIFIYMNIDINIHLIFYK
jgi:glutamine phosphoribosylpyrophosphate amidotransferase